MGRRRLRRLPFAAREAVEGGECDEGEEGHDGLHLEHPREASAVRDHAEAHEGAEPPPDVVRLDAELREARPLRPRKVRARAARRR